MCPDKVAPDTEERLKKKESKIPPTPKGDDFLSVIESGENNSVTPKTDFEIKLEEFREHRREKKKPFTAQGERNFKKKLNHLHQQGHDILAMMEEAMERGWLTVFPPKEEPQKQGWDAIQQRNL